jgi:hypothetical protein
MAEEDSQIVHPGCRKQNVVVELHPFTQAAGQGIEPGLVAELVFRQSLGANVGYDGFTPARRHY